MIDQKRLKLVHLAKRKVGLSEDEYRDVLANIGQVQSSTQLTDSGFDQLMAHFRKLGFVSDARRSIVSGNTERGMASQAQIALIKQLYLEVTGERSARKLESWMANRHGVSAMRFLSVAKATKVIGALKLWKQREAGK